MDARVAAVNVCIALVPILLAVGEARLVPLNNYTAGITRIHNYYRYQENATNMQMLTWDQTLARKAAEWSENCYWGHQKLGLGENLAYRWSSGTLKASDVVIKSIKGWYNEKFIWRWSTQCGAACHYTQIVWAKTTKVGCAYSICNKLRTTGTPVQNAHYFVCFYNPPGNYYGQYPFWYGQRCSKCGRNDICRKGLCCSRNTAEYSRYLPQGNRVEDELRGPIQQQPQQQPQQQHQQKQQQQQQQFIDIIVGRQGIPDRSKLHVSIDIMYDGSVLNTKRIKNKYERIVRNEVMSYLLRKNRRFTDD